MDKIKDTLTKIGRHRPFTSFKNLSIKHAFMVCMVLFVLFFFSLFVLFLEYADSQSDQIMSFHKVTRELPSESSAEYEIDNKEITVIMHNDDDRILGTGLLVYLNKYYVVIFCLFFALSIVLAGFAFYYMKLKKPLDALRNASEKISSNELDFTLEYECTDEMGKLVRSFEKMRSALYDNNRKMWNTIDEESKVYAAFAHDVRTPLTVVHGYTDFLETYIPDGKISEEKLLSTLHTVNENLIRLHGFVDTMSAIRTLDDIRIKTKAVNFNTLCERLEGEAEIISAGIGCEFTRSTDSKIVLVDENTVEQVFGNLTANAVRYAKQKITFDFSCKDGVFSLTVNDDGDGFSDEALRRALELFYHENYSDGNSHFGFGLYISKILCEKHGGKLTLSNNQGGRVTASFSAKTEKAR